MYVLKLQCYALQLNIFYMFVLKLQCFVTKQLPRVLLALIYREDKLV